MELNPTEIRLSASGMVRFLFGVLFFFFFGSVAAQIFGWKTGRWGLLGLNQLLNMDGDQGAPTWYNAFLLFLTATVSYLIARRQTADKARFRFHWRVLAAVFLVMSVDEVACIHERIGSAVFAKLNSYGLATGIFSSGFLIPGVILAVSAFLFFIPLLRSLPPKAMLSLLVAGAVYLSGCLLVETITSLIWISIGTDNLAYRLLAHVEELLEMSGLILFLRAGFGILKSSVAPGGAPEIRLTILS